MLGLPYPELKLPFYAAHRADYVWAQILSFYWSIGSNSVIGHEALCCQGVFPGPRRDEGI